jgi:hypothetical protein
MEKDGLTKKDFEEVKQLIEPKETIEKEVALGWDGKNITIRLPREITSYFQITKENRLSKTFSIKIHERDRGNIEKTFDIIQRTKPRRKKNAKKTINKQR